MILLRDFYRQPVQTVARALLGKRLVRRFDDGKAVGIILEAEAYDGEQDLACHARNGKTKRNAVMYGEAGHAYVYFTYGMHWMLNCVSGQDGYPAAVLIRTLYPLEGLEIIRRNRKGIQKLYWCDGPAKLTKALSIDGTFNGIDLCASNSLLFIEEGIQIPDEHILETTRIGIHYAPEPWRSKPWRYLVDDVELLVEAI